ncbi:MAG: glycosyltransferase [Betaproteobacteria bacterium]|nr:glycosyltransferase [Betaproteobacteria bacterium]
MRWARTRKSWRAAIRERPEAVLIVFSRAPRPGRVKSRLRSALGAAGAARLHAQLLARAVATARAARCGAVELHCAPHCGHALFRALARRHGIRLRTQAGGDLGARMHGALRGALARVDAAVLIGSDCPELRPADIRAAFAALRAGADLVLAPAEDGGYPLIGLRRASPALFDGMPWGGPEVLRETRRRAARLGWSLQELRTLWDVDRPADLARLRSRRLLSEGPLTSLRSGGSRAPSGVPGRP